MRRHPSPADPGHSPANFAARDALTTALQAYAPRLHAYVMRRMRRHPDAADLTQEIFERFLRVERIDRVRHPLRYLFGIAANVVSDARLAQERNPVTCDSEALDHFAAAPDDLAERLGLAQDLKYALSLLPDTHRAVLLLTKRDGLSYAEAAKRLNLKVSTVTSYAFEARARVKLVLKHRQG